MGQSSVLLAIAATLTVGILLFVAQRGTADADVDLAGYHYKVLAREAAATGMNMTVRKLVNDPDNWFAAPDTFEFVDEPYYGARFTTVVTSSHIDTVDIVSTGTDGEGTHVIEARYAKGYTSLGVPPALRYAIISDENLTLNGNGYIAALNDSSNANVHANGVLKANGRVDVEGYGTYGPDGSQNTPESVFDPNVDTNGPDPNVYEAEEIEVPEVVASDYNSIPPASHIVNGNLTLDTIDMYQWAQDLGLGPDVGTAEHPFLLFVDGDLTIGGGVEMLGYVQFVVDGNIKINGNVETSAVPIPDSNASQEEWDAWEAASLDAAGNTTIGFYSTGSIELDGNVSVVGNLYSNGTVTINGGGGQPWNVIGSITSANANLRFNGGVSIRYAQISEDALLPGWTNIVPEGVRLISWAEW